LAAHYRYASSLASDWGFVTAITNIVNVCNYMPAALMVRALSVPYCKQLLVHVLTKSWLLLLLLLLLRLLPLPGGAVFLLQRLTRAPKCTMCWCSWMAGLAKTKIEISVDDGPTPEMMACVKDVLKDAKFSARQIRSLTSLDCWGAGVTGCIMAAVAPAAGESSAGRRLLQQ
jgi:hypothetical protein